MTERDTETMALECVVAVIAGLLTIWVRQSVASIALIVITLGCIGLIDASNPIERGMRGAVLWRAVAVFWVFTVIGGYLDWKGSLFAFLQSVYLCRIFALPLLGGLCGYRRTANCFTCDPHV